MNNPTTDKLFPSITTGLQSLRRSQVDFIEKLVNQLQQPISITLGSTSKSDLLITQNVAEHIGDVLQIHHVFSRQPLTKDKFEFALESALLKAGVDAALVSNRTNRGHDITISGVPFSLKTQADANIRRDKMHISKFMELGQGKWELPLLRAQFLDHMKAYKRILQFRCLSRDDGNFEYELVEIPKSLLEKAASSELEIMHNSRQSPKPGYCKVYKDSNNKTEENLLFSLYFDGGSERKLQIKHICKSQCITHASWKFLLAPIE